MSNELLTVLVIAAIPLLIIVIFTIWYYIETCKHKNTIIPTIGTLLGLTVGLAWSYWLYNGLGEINEKEYNKILRNQATCIKSERCSKYFEEITKDLKITIIENKAFDSILENEIAYMKENQINKNIEIPQIKERLASINDEFKQKGNK